MPRKARPARIRVRLWDQGAPGVVALALPARSMRPAAIAFGIFFAIFAAIEWSVIDGLFGRSVADVFDLTFLVFQGFWALGWSVGAFYTVLKIAIVGKLGALVAAPFFVGHFGGFMAGHFLLIYAFFLRGNIGWVPGAAAELLAIFTPIWTSIAALFISHDVSFYTNFIGEREYEGATVSGLMTAPYHRVILMHLTLLAGGWIILLIGMPIGALVVLLLLKTAVDLRAHQREHAAAPL